MANDSEKDQDARRRRAEELRQQVKSLEESEQSGPATGGEDSKDMLPGESPKEYMQRRLREMEQDRARRVKK